MMEQFKITRKVQTDDKGHEFVEICVARRLAAGEKNWPCKLFEFNIATYGLRDFGVEKDTRFHAGPDDFVLTYRVGRDTEDRGMCFSLPQ